MKICDVMNQSKKPKFAMKSKKKMDIDKKTGKDGDKDMKKK